MAGKVCLALLLILACNANAQNNCQENSATFVGFTALTPDQLRSEIRSNLDNSMRETLDSLTKTITEQSLNAIDDINETVHSGLSVVQELTEDLEESMLERVEMVVQREVRLALADMLPRIIANLTLTLPTTETPATLASTTTQTGQPTTEPPTEPPTEPTTPTPIEPTTPTPIEPTTLTPTEPTTTMPTEPPTPPSLGSTPLNPAGSCQHILSSIPQAPSGYYWVLARQEGGQTTPVRVFCDMERSCGGLTGGWMRVANLNTTDTQQSCPSDFQIWTYDNPPLRLCRTVSTKPGCIGTPIATNGLQYSHVCGRVIGYQDRTPNAFFNYHISIDSSLTIDDPYMDGISLTYGTEREHIWTFVAALDETLGHLSACSCSNNAARQNARIPDFIRNNYFCDTGSRTPGGFQFYGADPLWDGSGCGQISSCCSFNNPPWFYRSLVATSDDIELRVCRDSPVSNEDILIEIVELYVR